MIKVVFILMRIVFISLLILGLIGCREEQKYYDDVEQANHKSIGKYEFSTISKDAAFPSKDGAGLVNKDNSLYLIGGWSVTDCFPKTTANDVWQSSGSLTTRLN